MDLRAGSEGPAHASLSPVFFVGFFFFAVVVFLFKDEIKWEEELFVWFYLKMLVR